MSYPTGPYPYGGFPSRPYPDYRAVGPGPVFNGSYTTNVVTDRNVQNLLDEANGTQQAYYDAFSSDPNMAWYNSAIAPTMIDAYNKTSSILGRPGVAQPQRPYPSNMPRAVYPATAGMPGQFPPGYGEMPKEKGSAMGAIAKGAALGGLVGGVCGAGLFSVGTAAIGAVIGGALGGLAHALF